MKIVIVDDHPIVRDGVTYALQQYEDMEIIGSAKDGLEALGLIEEKRPDVAIVDLRMPGRGGIELVQKARSLSVNTRYIILTSYALPEDVKMAVATKIEGYVLKEALPEELVNAVRLVGKGRKYYDPEVLGLMMELKEQDDLDNLTPRELEVLGELANGLSNKAIAGKIFVSESTVKKHVANILDKLYFEDRTQAALYGYARGLGKGCRAFSDQISNDN